MLEHLFIYNTDFKPWSIQHVVPLVLFTLVGYLFIRWGQKTTNTRAKWRAPFLWSLLLPASIILWILIRLARGEFDVNDDIPLHMCNLVTFFLPLTFLKNRKVLFGILYLWVMSGTLQAVLTPGLEQAFPHYWYFRYWLIHCGLVIFTLYGIIVLEYRVEPKHILYAFLALNGLFLFAHGFNYIVGSNYLYTMAKPDQPSLLDFFGPWPWYILTSEFVGLLFFIFYYTPFLYLSRKSNRSK